MPVFTINATSQPFDMDAFLAGLQISNITGVPAALSSQVAVDFAGGLRMFVFGGPLVVTNFNSEFSGPVDNVTFQSGGVNFASLTGSQMPFASLFGNAASLFSGDDTINGNGTTPYSLYGYGGNDVLTMTDGASLQDADSLYGGEGNDTLQIDYAPGGFNATIGPNDAIFGGAGTDTLWINTNGFANFSVLTTPPQGIEVLRVTNNGGPGVLTLPGTMGILNLPDLTHLESLGEIFATAAGTYDFSRFTWTGVTTNGVNSNVSFVGSSGDDTFIAPSTFINTRMHIYNGGSGNDTLIGSAAVAETMFGGSGDDTFIIGAGDVVNEQGFDSVDLVQSTVSADLNAFLGVENLTLIGTAAISGTGSTGTNVITGNAAANYLSGGGGVDTLQGAAGNDTYLLEAGVTVTEALNAGTDTALTLTTAALATNVERLILLGDSNINGTGNALANRITGNDGNNRIDGGAGVDRLIGAEGDDTYVFTAGDVIIELEDEGTDTVESSVTVTLAAEVENLLLTGALVANGTGNTLANRLTGNTAANTLNGGEGIDTLVGGLGNDTYLVDNAADVVTELAGGTDDTVRASVTYTLVASANIETLAAAAGTVAIDLTGNALAQEIVGNGGANVINGLSGADTLTGGSGADTFIFSAALATMGTDVITDFSRALDIIHLQNSVFTTLTTPGALAATAFVANTTGLAGDTSDRIIYETDTGIIRYDSNGSASGGTQVTFARLQTPLALDFTDFAVI